MKKVLVFAPYGQWLVHHQLDAIVGAALMRRGCSVFAICCDGIFRNCIIARNAGKCEPTQANATAKLDAHGRFKLMTGLVNSSIDPQRVGEESLAILPSLDVCRNCFKSATHIFGGMKIPFLKLSTFVGRDDILEADGWAKESISRDLETLAFRGLPIWKWVNAMIYGMVRSSDLDLKQPWIRDLCVDTLYNGALLISALEKALEVLKPEQQLCYNGGHPYYRISYELARKRNINVLVHERGQIDDSFFLLSNRVNNIDYDAYAEWSSWRGTPLDQVSLERVCRLAQEREKGTNYNFQSFHNWDSEAGTIRARLRIDNDRPIVTIFSTLDWEFSISKALGQVSIFDTQFDWIQATADICEREGWNLVVRHHPLNGGTKTYPSATHFLCKCFSFNPTHGDHVRIVMPTERISSYDIIWNSDAVAAVFSTTAWEAAIRGVAPIYVSRFIFTEMGMSYASSLEEYEEKLRDMVRGSRDPSPDSLKFTYRLINFLYFNVMSHRFKSFGIKNHYQADLRLTSAADLDRGKDPTLDRVCEYIISGSPLYEMPDGNDYSRTESDFTAAQIEEINRRRTAVRDSASADVCGIEEPRVDLICANTGPRSSFSKLARLCINKSRYRNLQVTGMSAGPDGADGFKAFLSRVASELVSDYACVLPDNALITEAAVSSAMGMLANSSGASGVFWGMYWIPGNKELKEELFTQINPDPGLAAVLKRVPPLAKPINWMPLALWRTSALREFTNGEIFRLTRGETGLAVLLYETFLSSGSKFLKQTDPSVALLTDC